MPNARPSETLDLVVRDMIDSPHVVAWCYAHAVLEATGGNISAAARRMGMHRRTLQRMMAKRPKLRAEAKQA